VSRRTIVNRPRTAPAIVSAANGALESLARALALELAPVRVNAVSPGVIDTQIRAAMPEEARRDMLAKTAAALLESLSTAAGDFTAAWSGARVPEPAHAAWPAVVELFATLSAVGAHDVPAQVHAVRSVYGPLLERKYDNVQARLRDLELKKAPSIAETVDWARTLIALEIGDLDVAEVERTLGVVLKHASDHDKAITALRRARR